MKYLICCCIGLCGFRVSAQLPATTTVHYRGALKTIMHQGDLSAKASPDSLANDHIYGLGAATDLKGEWVLWNGHRWLSKVENGQLVTDKDPSGSAAMLVWSHMDTFHEEVVLSFKNEAELQHKIMSEAAKKGIDTTAPFPFLLFGQMEVDWHVIDWQPGDTEHSHEKHRQAGLHGKRKLKNGQIIGFYSPNHAGIFTHHSTRLHLHLLDEANPLAAHVDEIAARKVRLVFATDSVIRSAR